MSLLEETGHERLRPAAGWVAAAVPADRGDLLAAERHARLAAAGNEDDELMIVTAAPAKAHAAAAADDHEAVLHALEPVRVIEPRDGVDEPGFWPWQHLYGGALIGIGRLAEADRFLVDHEKLAADRKRRSSIAASLAYVANWRPRPDAPTRRRPRSTTVSTSSADSRSPSRLRSCNWRTDSCSGVAVDAGRQPSCWRALATASPLSVLLHGWNLRHGADRLQARPAEEALLPQPRRHGFDPARLTAQELAVARRAAAGMSNREIASEMRISPKTVQFHIGNVY